jgi:cytochrome c
MQRTLIVLSLSALLGACSLGAAPQTPPPTAAAQPDAIATGQRMAQEKCAVCHAIGRADTGPMADAPPLRTLSASYKIADLEEAFAEGILVGHPAMPEFKFTPAEITALLAYLTSIQDQPANAAKP